jgi:diguanylate cyclase (GGDEF)-like protein
MFKLSRRYEKIAIPIAAVLMCSYLFVLIGTTYFGQQQLTASVTDQLRLGLEKRANALSYFFSERRDDLLTLSQAKAVQAFFANQALGMSMEYGLRASLLSVQKGLEAATSQKRIGDEPVFRYLAFYDHAGEPLVSTPQSTEDHPYLDVLLKSNEKNVSISVQNVGGTPSVFALSRVNFKNRWVGTLIGRIETDAAFNKLVSTTLDTDSSGLFLYCSQGFRQVNRVGMLPDDKLAGELSRFVHSENDSIRLQGGLIALKVAVTDEPFSLIGVFAPQKIPGQLASPLFVAALIGLAIPVLLGVGFLIRLNNSNLVLSTRVNESQKQEGLLTTQNRRLASEIKKRLEYERKLAYQANYDPLTHLPNRQLALDRLTQALKRARRDGNLVLLMFLDLDHFKQVNDTVGHAAGDQLLVEAADRLKHALRDSDTVARLGGDEFVVICADLQNRDGAELLAEGVLGSLSAPFSIQNREFFVTASIGMAFYPDDGEESQSLLKNADLALYQAKDAGRAGYKFFTSKMDQAANKRLTMESYLRHAIERDELYVRYQPIVHLDTGDMVGVEALLRWHNPKLGEVYPDQFIPLAEETGLIHEMGEWVFRQACKDAIVWQHKRPLRLAINISPRQFSSPARFVETVLDTLEETGMPPSLLELEITEGALLIDLPEVTRLLEEFESLGMRLSIDDFGTGYSALGYLQRFPFDVLKIDRSFIQDVLSNPLTSALAKAIVAMAKALKLEVIGEGVETDEQAEYLRKIGCDLAQGYLFSKPVDKATIDTMLDTPTVARAAS